MTNRDEPYLIKGDVLRETEKAWLFQCDTDGENYWLPKSQCTWDGTEYIMTVPGWLVQEKEIPL